MKRLYPILTLLVVVMAAVAFSGCSEDEPETTPYTEVTIVTLKQPVPAVLTLYKRDGTVKELIDRSKAFTDEVKPGQRLVIEYTAQLEDTVLSMIPIQLKQAGIIPWGDVKVAYIEEIMDLKPGRLSVVSQWITGPYINYQVLMDFDGNPRTFAAVVDRETLENDVVDCYLYNPGEAVVENGVERRSFGSFDLSSLHLRPGQTIKTIVR